MSVASRGIGHEVAGELLAGEPIKRHIGREGPTARHSPERPVASALVGPVGVVGGLGGRRGGMRPHRHRQAAVHEREVASDPETWHYRKPEGGERNVMIVAPPGALLNRASFMAEPLAAGYLTCGLGCFRFARAARTGSQADIRRGLLVQAGRTDGDNTSSAPTLPKGCPGCRPRTSSQIAHHGRAGQKPARFRRGPYKRHWLQGSRAVEHLE